MGGVHRKVDASVDFAGVPTSGVRAAIRGGTLVHRLAVAFVLLALASPVLADYDPELERQEAAQREAAQKEQARRNAEAKRIRGDAELRMMREFVGADAAGKSDAEVRRLYEARVKANEQAARAAAASAPTAAEAEKMQRDAEAGTATVEEMTGKSIEELENMSDEEAEALQRELEKKYGGQ
jgi:hypothetical protein